MIGEYAYADRFEDVSRAGEDAAAGEARDFAARAEAVDEDGLDDGDAITRSMLVWDATSRAEMLEARTTEFAANPIFGVQTSLGVYLPKLGDPGRGRRGGDGRQVRERRDLLPTTSPTGTARGSPRGARRPTSRCDRLLRSSTPGWPPRSTRTRCSPCRTRRRASTPPAGASGSSRSCRSRCGPRPSATATCCATRSPRRPVPTSGAGSPTCPTATRSTRSSPASSPPPTARPRRSTRPDCGRWLPSRRSIAPSAPRSSAPTTCRRSSRPCATTRSCTTPAATRSWPTPRPRWPRPGRRWGTGSAGCRSPTATSRRRPAARSPTTSRRPRTARAAGCSS